MHMKRGWECWDVLLSASRDCAIPLLLIDDNKMKFILRGRTVRSTLPVGRDSSRVPSVRHATAFRIGVIEPVNCIAEVQRHLRTSKSEGFTAPELQSYYH